MEIGEDAVIRRRMFPIQGWAFIIGFILFPAWWIAAVLPVGWGWGKRKDAQDGKGVDPEFGLTDDEKELQRVVAYDVEYTWRKRCRIMSLFGLFLYVPLIILLAVLVPKA